MSTVSVIHVFYEVYMGWSHASLHEVMKENAKKSTLDKGEVALFVNKSWTAVKLLTTSNTLLYHRATSGSVDLETIRSLPLLFGGSRLIFSKNLEANLIKTMEARGAAIGRNLKVAYA